MKKLVWLILLLTPPCLAQLDDNQRTAGSVNGRFWANLSSTSKLYFIMGLDEGMGLAFAKPSDEKVYFPRAPYGDIVKGLDSFYQEPENLIFPINNGLRIFTMKVNGATQAEVAAEVAELRRDVKLLEQILKNAPKQQQ